jgi:hypothetical protein
VAGLIAAAPLVALLAQVAEAPPALTIVGPSWAGPFSVSGRVETSSGIVSPHLAVTVHLQADGGSSSLGGSCCTLMPDGRFSVRGLSSGTYIVSVAPALDDFGQMAPGVERGTRLVTIRDADVRDVVIRVAPGAVVRGRVQFDGDPPSATLPSDLKVDAPLVITDWRGPYEYAPIAADGSFEFAALAGPRIFRIGGFSVEGGRTWWFSRVLVGERDVTNEALDPAGLAGQSLQIVMTQRPTAIVGRVEDMAGLSVGSACVVLVPANADLRAAWSTAVGTTSADNRGRFYFVGLPAGEYSVAAYETAECRDVASWLDRSDEIVRTGTSVAVNAGSIARVAVPARSTATRH